MSQTTKDLNDIDKCVGIAQYAYYSVIELGENSEHAKSLRERLIAAIPASLAKILAQASDEELRDLTLMQKVAGPAEEVRRAARIRLEPIETADNMKKTRLLLARWRQVH